MTQMPTTGSGVLSPGAMGGPMAPQTVTLEVPVELIDPLRQLLALIDVAQVPVLPETTVDPLAGMADTIAARPGSL